LKKVKLVIDLTAIHKYPVGVYFMSTFPTRTLTFLFADIKGSTPLWEQHPEAMKPSLLRHDIILHKAIPENSEKVFKLISDAFEAAFTILA
jgi:class 3 adenylate cyclase